MALTGVPYATGNGALNSVENARLVPYNATGGQGGVGDRNAMRVTALPTPGAAVRVTSGPVTIINEYPNVRAQAYVEQELSSTDVPIPATGSTGGATRFVIVRVDDPTQGGQEPPSAEEGPYSRYEVVSSVTGLAFPHEVLARIDQPANTGTITQNMITDMRRLAQPHWEPFLRSSPSPTGESGQTLGATAYAGEQFPDNGIFDLLVPAWCTRIQVRYEWLGVRMSNTDKAGHLWLHWGRPGVGYEGATQRFGFDGATTDVSRQFPVVADWFWVPPALRGQTIRFWPQGRITYGTRGVVEMTEISGVSISGMFIEDPLVPQGLS